MNMEPRVSADDVNNMIGVLQFEQPGHITYLDFVEHFKEPDKWGHCSAFSGTLPLGKSGEGPAPIDSATMEKVWARSVHLSTFPCAPLHHMSFHNRWCCWKRQVCAVKLNACGCVWWHRQGKKHPKEMLKDKKRQINDMIADGKSMPFREPKTGSILIKGRAKEGHLDKFLLEAIKDKIKSLKGNSREVFKSWDPYREGRVSKANFHRGIASLGLAIPTPAVEEVMRYLDTDNNGYVELVSRLLPPSLKVPCMGA